MDTYEAKDILELRAQVFALKTLLALTLQAVMEPDLARRALSVTKEEAGRATEELDMEQVMTVEQLLADIDRFIAQ